MWEKGVFDMNKMKKLSARRKVNKNTRDKVSNTERKNRKIDKERVGKTVSER